jgi:hypothetical protein
MGDASGITLLSAVPLLIFVVSIVAAAAAWWSRRRAIRTVVAVLLIVVGVPCILSSAGMLFAVAGGATIGVLGVVLLIVEYGGKNNGSL